MAYENMSRKQLEERALDLDLMLRDSLKEVDRLRDGLEFIANAPLGYGRVKLGIHAQKILRASPLAPSPNPNR